MAVEIGYIGSKGTHLGRLRTSTCLAAPEAAYLAGIAVQTCGPTRFSTGRSTYFNFHSNSIYNAGKVSLRRRGRGGTFFRLNYSYSKSIDDSPAQWKRGRGADRRRAGHQQSEARPGPLGLGPRPRGDGGILVGAPGGPREAAVRSLRGWRQAAIGDWQLASTAYLATGAPLTPVAADVNLNLGESQKPNRVGRGIPEEVAGQRRGMDYPWFPPPISSRRPAASR